MRKILIIWVICAILGILICNFLMWNLNVHETYTAENLAWQIENRAILLKKHRFYAELSLVFLGAEILSFGMLVFLSVKENKKK